MNDELNNRTVTDCRSPDGITVGLIDTIINCAHLLAERDISSPAAIEALADLRSDAELKALCATEGGNRG